MDAGTFRLYRNSYTGTEVCKLNDYSTVCLSAKPTYLVLNLETVDVPVFAQNFYWLPCFLPCSFNPNVVD